MGNKVLAVLGPTASGKTALTLELAKRFNGVIVNCDSRQIYEEMFIGTASPTESEKKQAAHRLFNYISPLKQINAGDYAYAAAEEIKKIWAEGRLPILAGGTGFYYSSISEGLTEVSSDEKLAAELEQQYQEKGLEYMADMLRQIDPEAGQNVDLNNPRRVLRAIEVVKITGRPFSQNQPKPLLSGANFYPIVVTRPREVLHQRIEARIDQMLKEGLEKETRYIVEKYGRDAAALSSIGYREFLDYFDRKITLAEVREQILFHTRQYAKRQETWFRKKPGVPFTDLSAISLDDCLKRVATYISSF